MKLGRITANPAATEGKYRLTAPPHINEQIVAYGAMYKSVYNEEIPPETMILAILAQFFEADADFRTWRRDTDPATLAPAAEPARRRPRTGSKVTSSEADEGAKEPARESVTISS